MISGAIHGRFLWWEEVDAKIRAANSSDRRKRKSRSDLRCQICAVNRSRQSGNCDQPESNEASSADQRIGKFRDQLHEIGLAGAAGLPVEVAEMGLDRGFGDAERLGDLGNAADLDRGMQDLELHWREL